VLSPPSLHGLGQDVSEWLSTIGKSPSCSRFCPFMDFGKTLKEKLRRYLNFTGTPHVVTLTCSLSCTSGCSEWLSTIGVSPWCSCFCPFMDFSKMLKEKLRSYLNSTGTPHLADPYVFVALRFSSSCSIRPPTLCCLRGCRSGVLQVVANGY
jgi:hypothetical protein